MQCQRVQLKLLQKGKSSLNRRQQKHLQNCPECGEFVNTIHRLETCGSDINYGEPGRRLDMAVQYRVRQLSPETPASATEVQVRRWLTPLAAIGAVLILASIFLWHLEDMQFFSPAPSAMDKIEERTENFFPEGLIKDEMISEIDLQRALSLTELEEQLWILEVEMAEISLDLEEDYQIWYAEVE